MSQFTQCQGSRIGSDSLRLVYKDMHICEFCATQEFLEKGTVFKTGTSQINACQYKFRAMKTPDCMIFVKPIDDRLGNFGISAKHADKASKGVGIFSLPAETNYQIIIHPNKSTCDGDIYFHTEMTVDGKEVCLIDPRKHEGRKIKVFDRDSVTVNGFQAGTNSGFKFVSDSVAEKKSTDKERGVIRIKITLYRRIPVKKQATVLVDLSALAFERPIYRSFGSSHRGSTISDKNTYVPSQPTEFTEDRFEHLTDEKGIPIGYAYTLQLIHEDISERVERYVKEKKMEIQEIERKRIAQSEILSDHDKLLFMPENTKRRQKLDKLDDLTKKPEEKKSAPLLHTVDEKNQVSTDLVFYEKPSSGDHLSTDKIKQSTGNEIICIRRLHKPTPDTGLYKLIKEQDDKDRHPCKHRTLEDSDDDDYEKI